MITLKINGKEIQTEEGKTIFQVALEQGIDIPHFCYHPGLSISGNCRMCLVEIAKVPKLQISCATPAREGMEVLTDSERVRTARRNVLEFLLINHPVDCPICDQAGECSLQNYYQHYGLYQSRFREQKITKGKVIDLGSGVILDQERCVLCGRCVRFMRDIALDEQLGIFNRGNHSEIQTFHGRPLDSIYAGNVHDICPVGALTSKDFRFKCRVWYLHSTPTICAGCATGCNIYVDHYQNRIYRIRPRSNPDINSYWMCDLGRQAYKPLYTPERIVTAFKRKGNRLTKADYSTLVPEMAGKLKELLEQYGPKQVGVIVRPTATNEDSFLIARFCEQVLETKNIDSVYEPEQEQVEDTILVKADKNPNTQGCQALELLPKRGGGMSIKDMLSAARLGSLRALIVVDLDLFSRPSQEKGIISAFENIDLIILLQLEKNRMTDFAHYVLPITHWAEREGTFTNFEGVVQKLMKAVEPPPAVHTPSAIFVDLARAMGVELLNVADQELQTEILAKIVASKESDETRNND